MSVTTSQRFNQDDFQAALPQGATYGWVGGPFEDAGEKTITADGATDQQLTTAITTASGVFVDRKANQVSLLAKAAQAVTVNNTFLALSTPTNAQIVAQVQRLTRENTALIKFLLSDFSDTSGT